MSFSVATPFGRVTDTIRNALGGITWRPILSVSKSIIVSTFSRIVIGQLLLTTEDGEILHFGQSQKQNRIVAKLTVRKEAFWVRLLLFADMVG